MNIFQHNRTRLLFAGVVASLFLTGCNWVDSAGGGGSGGTGTEITLDAIPLGGAAAVLEETTPRIKVARQSLAFDRAYRFDETPSLEGALDACLSLDGFDADRAADTLTEACSSAEDECRFVAESDVTNSDELAFTLVVPTLRAPVGRRHTLSTGREVVAEDGSVSFVEEARRDIDFCLLSMNEAPDAGDDTYVLVEGEILDVSAADGVLVNDQDDDDAGNQPLRVNPTPVSAPSEATVFELREDGSFTYEFGGSDIRTDLRDVFEYEVTDGSLSTTAEVSVRIIAGNQAPVLLQSPDDYMATVGEFFVEDLSGLFEDPEGLELEFSFIEDLPADGTLALTPEGTFSGTPGAGDEGIYVLTLVADDGVSTTEVLVNLMIEEGTNSPPEFVSGSVFNQTVDLGDPIRDVVPIFIDPDGDELTYRNARTALPDGVELDTETGVVSGVPTEIGFARFLLIEASDPDGETAQSIIFSIRVQ